MTSHDDNFAKKLTGYLDAGTAELKAGTAYRLQKARAAAIERLAQPARRTRIRIAACACLCRVRRIGNGRRQGSLLTSVRLWLGIAIIVAAAFGYQQWQVYQTGQRPRGTGRPAAVLGLAHRRVPGPGIPQLAYERRKVTATLGFALALLAVSTALAPDTAQAQITMRSPSWSQLTPAGTEGSGARRARVGQARCAAQAEMARPGPALSVDGAGPAAARPAADAILGEAVAAGTGRRARAIQDTEADAAGKKGGSAQRWQEYQSLPPETKRDLAATPPAPAGRTTRRRPSTAARHRLAVLRRHCNGIRPRPPPGLDRRRRCSAAAGTRRAVRATGRRVVRTAPGDRAGVHHRLPDAAAGISPGHGRYRHTIDVAARAGARRTVLRIVFRRRALLRVELDRRPPHVADEDLAHAHRMPDGRRPRRRSRCCAISSAWIGPVLALGRLS